MFLLPPTSCTYSQTGVFFSFSFFLPSSALLYLVKQAKYYTNKMKFCLFLGFLMLCCGEVNEPWREVSLSSLPSLLCHWGMQRGSERHMMHHGSYYIISWNTWEMVIGKFTLFLQCAHWLDSTDELCFNKRHNWIFFWDKIVTRVFAFASFFL